MSILVSGLSIAKNKTILCQRSKHQNMPEQCGQNGMREIAQVVMSLEHQTVTIRYRRMRGATTFTTPTVHSKSSGEMKSSSKPNAHLPNACVRQGHSVLRFYRPANEFAAAKGIKFASEDYEFRRRRPTS